MFVSYVPPSSGTLLLLQGRVVDVWFSVQWKILKTILVNGSDTRAKLQAFFGLVVDGSIFPDASRTLRKVDVSCQKAVMQSVFLLASSGQRKTDCIWSTGNIFHLNHLILYYKENWWKIVQNTIMFCKSYYTQNIYSSCLLILFTVQSGLYLIRNKRKQNWFK